MQISSLLESDIPPQQFAAGTTIFETGQPGDVMYIVKDGEVDIKIGGRVVETVGAGGIFGEMALIEAANRSAAAVARTNCDLVPITQKRFLFMIDETPFFAVEVMRIMSRRLRNAAAQPQSDAP